MRIAITDYIGLITILTFSLAYLNMYFILTNSRFLRVVPRCPDGPLLHQLLHQAL